MTRTLHTRPATALPPVGTHADVYFATPQGRMGCSGTVMADTYHPGCLVILKRLDTTGRSVPVVIKPEMLLEVNGRRFQAQVADAPAPLTGRTVTMTWNTGRKAAWNFDTPSEAFEWAMNLSLASERSGHGAEVRVIDRLTDAEVEAINGAL